MTTKPFPQVTTEQLLKLAGLDPDIWPPRDVKTSPQDGGSPLLCMMVSYKAREVHEAVVKTDKNQMGFTRTEVMKVNEALWQYECAMHAYAKEHGKEAAYKRHKNMGEAFQGQEDIIDGDEVRKNVDRAFVMVKRRLEKCIDDAQSA